MKAHLPLLLLGLLSTGCKTALPVPDAPSLPEVPRYELPKVPDPPTAPGAPKEPTYDLPSSSDVDWRDIWTDSFSSDGVKSEELLEGGGIGVVFPVGVDDALRVGMISAALKDGSIVHDLGHISDSGLQFVESVGNDKLHLSLIDLAATWVASTTAEGSGIDRIFRVHVLEVYPERKEVVKFDIAPHLSSFESYNAAVPGHNASVVAYDGTFARYRARYRIYEANFNKWRERVEEQIEGQRSEYDESVAQEVERFEASWSKHVDSLPKKRKEAPVEKPTFEVQPYVAPTLPLLVKQGVREPVRELAVLSISEMRSILIDIATEHVDCQTVHLIGQVVSQSTGETTCTVDSLLKLPSERNLSRGRLVRTLIERISQ